MPAKLVGLTRGEALKTSTFWFIAIAFALIGIGEQGPFQNFPTYIVGNGFDLAVAGSFMTVISLSGVFGKLASGVIIDFVGPRIAYCILNSLAVIGLVLIIFVGDNIVLLFARLHPVRRGAQFVCRVLLVGHGHVPGPQALRRHLRHRVLGQAHL